MRTMRLVVLLLPTLACAFSFHQSALRGVTRPSISALQSTATKGVEEKSYLIEDEHVQPITYVIDVASIVSCSNFPWTVEALAASAPLMVRNPNDAVILFLQQHQQAASATTLLFSGGPLGRGVGILWVGGDDNNNDFHEQLSEDDNVQMVSHNILSVAANKTTATALSPIEFLSDLESMGPRMQLASLQSSGSSSSKVQSYLDLQDELQELRDILKPQRRHRQPKKGISRKQRTKLKKRTTKLATKQQQSLSPRPGYNVSADAAIFRRRLEESGECQQQGTIDVNDSRAPSSLLSLIKSVMKQDDELLTASDNRSNIQRPIGGASLSHQVLRVTRRSNITTPLRMVVLSDTHGFEDHFLKLSGNKATDHKGKRKYAKLPDADVLIHCGDFDGPNRRLDAFMAAQTHIPTQIVIRGNHDPRQYSFSTADYFTKREMIILPDGTHLEARPFVRSRSPQATLDPCDILASHEPPFGLCDQTYRQERVGSLPLRHAVEQSHVTPALWLCGHIHEGRGAVWHDFASSSASTTAVVNAANANSGKARRVTTGPVVIELVPKDM